MANAADTKQVKKAEFKEKDLEKQRLNDIRTVLSNASGRRFIWKLMSKCNTFGSVYSEQPSTMAYLSGQQDLGHYVMSSIIEADENLLLKIMKENQKDRSNK